MSFNESTFGCLSISITLEAVRVSAIAVEAVRVSAIADEPIVKDKMEAAIALGTANLIDSMQCSDANTATSNTHVSFILSMAKMRITV
jgi:hypothetical protein